MEHATAIAEVFVIALKNLDEANRDEVLKRIFDDDELREELYDAELMLTRRDDPVRDFEEYASERGE